MAEPFPASAHCGAQGCWGAWSHLTQHQGAALQRSLFRILLLFFPKVSHQVGLSVGAVPRSAFIPDFLLSILWQCSVHSGDVQQPQTQALKHGGLGTLKGMATAFKTNKTPKMFPLFVSRIQLRCSALPKGKSMVCLDSLLLSVYVSVFILFKELVHNQS